jgi:hypothetical protein
MFVADAIHLCLALPQLPKKEHWNKSLSASTFPAKP